MDVWPIVAESVAPSHCETRQVERRRPRTLPVLLTVDETADLLRTTRRAIYAMIARGHLPGVVHVHRRILVRSEALLEWLDQKTARSPREDTR